MKRIVAVASMMLVVMSAFAGEGADLKVLDDVWDFGRVSQGESKSKVFEIKNSGFEDLVIERIHTCCGYGVKDVSSWKLEPGERSSIEIICSAQRKSQGRDKKYITILSNSIKTPQIKIPVTASVVKGRNIPSQKEKPAKRPFQRTKLDTEFVASMSAIEAYSRLEKGYQLMILDVREKSEYLHKHIPNSIRFSRSELAKDEEALKNLFRNVQKGTPILVHCGSGTRSSYVTSLLRGWGHKAFNMGGGIKSWGNFGLPLSIGPEIESSKEPIPINLKEAYEHYYQLFNKKTVWIDVREKSQFRYGHIKGAINIPVFDITMNLDSIPKDKNIILYCQDIDCSASKEAALTLLENGYKQGRIRVFTGGYELWSRMDYPTETLE